MTNKDFYYICKHFLKMRLWLNQSLQQTLYKNKLQMQVLSPRLKSLNTASHNKQPVTLAHFNLNQISSFNPSKSQKTTNQLKKKKVMDLIQKIRKYLRKTTTRRLMKGLIGSTMKSCEKRNNFHQRIIQQLQMEIKKRIL